MIIVGNIEKYLIYTAIFIKLLVFFLLIVPLSDKTVYANIVLVGESSFMFSVRALIYCLEQRTKSGERSAWL